MLHVARDYNYWVLGAVPGAQVLLLLYARYGTDLRLSYLVWEHYLHYTTYLPTFLTNNM